MLPGLQIQDRLLVEKLTDRPGRPSAATLLCSTPLMPLTQPCERPRGLLLFSVVW